ncbi:MAG: tRNA 4-thiouridine(8) synthase ThiI [Acidobacteria bacterium]|nr:MAG: tRNA 4-thiouridine(8) synthase ThiI [Acidobacteriota bacterium]
MTIIVRYHEIALKGRNRPFFVDRLAGNLRQALSDLPGVDVRPLSARVSVEVGDDAPWDTVRARVGSVFGVANFSRAQPVPADLEALKRAALDGVRAASFSSFRVTTRRSDKSFPRNSAEIDRELGAAIHEATGVRVDLEHPELTVWVEVLRDRILLSFAKYAGPGGFPVGTSGRVMALLSGGIDSPVAAWRMMKRGCRAVLTHFHAFPLQDRSTIDKTRELARILTRWQLRTRLLLVPFGPVQQAVVAACPAPLRVVLYRRFMIRIAEALARRHRARALVTGESLGQVASQTLDNMIVIGEAARLPVLRPLVGMDKEEITEQARRIGTFGVSTLPDQDCCQLFVPRHPATAARREEVERAEEALDVPVLVAAAVEGAAEERFEFPGPTGSR